MPLLDSDGIIRRRLAMDVKLKADLPELQSPIYPDVLVYLKL